jgi:hypothetical protein
MKKTISIMLLLLVAINSYALEKVNTDDILKTLYMYDIIKFQCKEPPKITHVDKSTKPLAIEDKDTKKIALTFWRQKITYLACGKSVDTTVYYKVWGDQKEVNFSIKSESDPTPLIGTKFEGSFTSTLLRKDTFDGIVKFLYSKKCSISKKQAMNNTKFYVSSPIKPVKLVSKNKQKTVLQWGEKWSVNACGKNYVFPITFTGDGVGGAFWKINKPNITTKDIT